MWKKRHSGAQRREEAERIAEEEKRKGKRKKKKGKGESEGIKEECEMWEKVKSEDNGKKWEGGRTKRREENVGKTEKENKE